MSTLTRKFNRRLSVSGLLTISLIISACGGGGGSDGGSSQETGQFKDSNVTGMNYESGSISGVTGPNGTFTYEAGQPITFSVGGVPIGTTTGKTIITPVDLVPGSDSENTEVANIGIFLQMLDNDDDLSNGIVISPAVQSLAADWLPIDFLKADPQSDYLDYQVPAIAADMGNHTIRFANEASGHISETHSCIYSGVYKGKVDGTNFIISIDPATNNILGDFYNNGVNVGSISLRSFDGLDSSNPEFSGSVSSIPFKATFTSADEFNGTSDAGSFTGRRILSSSSSTAYRFTGSLQSQPGVSLPALSFVLHVSTNGTVNGAVYDPSSNRQEEVTGSVDINKQLTLNSPVGSGTGILDRDQGTVSGTFTSSEGLTYTAGGNGCRLN